MKIDVSKLKPLEHGEGKFGKCYILDEETIYKEFKPVIEEELIICRESLVPLVEKENETFILPRYLNCEDKILLGYTMRYINAPCLRRLGHNISLSKLALATPKVYQDIDNLSNNKIITADVNDRNILFDENIHIIDSDFYTIGDNPSKILLENRKNYNNAIMSYICETSMTKNEIEKFIMSDFYLKYLYNLLESGGSKEAMVEFLTILKMKVSAYADREVDNLKDVYKILKK